MMDRYKTIEYTGAVCYDPTDSTTLEMYEMLGYLYGNDILIMVNPPKMFVFCNDVFAWGCADGQDITYDQIQDLFLMCVENEKCGSIRWCCIQRNEKPQAPMEKYMREKGGWDGVLEALPENRYDTLRTANKILNK